MSVETTWPGAAAGQKGGPAKATGRNGGSPEALSSSAATPCREAGADSPLAGRRVAVLIPAYNEERFIGSVVLKARRYTANVIVVDDGSTDGTADVARAAGAVVVAHDCNQGKGAALNTAFRLAREGDPEVVVMLDADGQHLPEEICRVVLPVLRGEADLVVGSRYLQNASNTPRHRILGHRFFNLLTNLASGVRASDSQSGYRAFSPRAVEALAFHSRGFSVESEMQFIAHEHGLRLAEVPITIRYTDKPKRSVWAQGLRVLNGVLRLVGQYRPLFFFGLTGLAEMLAGLGWGLVVVERFNHFGDLAIGYAMLCLLLSIIGMVSLSTGVILHSVRGLLVEELLKLHGRRRDDRRW